MREFGRRPHPMTTRQFIYILTAIATAAIVALVLLPDGRGACQKTQSADVCELTLNP